MREINFKVLMKGFWIGLTCLPVLSYANSMDNMRTLRYCEVIVAHGLKATVYNTIGLNDCPNELWSKVNISNVKKETGSHIVYLNGPRYFMMDGAQNTNFINSKVQTFDGLEMREAGILSLTLKDLLMGSTPYREHTVNRKTTWVYKAGRPVYELINPQGQVFIMQSYSIQEHPQTEASLANLGSELKLPSGWRFKTGVLKQDVHLVALNESAVVVQDTFKNTYQLAPQDFL